MLTVLREWSQKRKLRAMLGDPRSTRGFRSAGQFEKGIGADRPTSAEHRREKGRRRGRVDAQSALSAAFTARN